MKEDLKRRMWAIALIGLASFFFYPVVAAFMAGEIKDYPTYAKGIEAYTRDMISLMSFDNGAAVFGMVIASLICGLSSFSYLNSKSKVDFYHGIPVRREKLYAANYINGILILAVPYTIAVVLSVIVGVTNGISSPVLAPTALEACGLNLVYYILMYSTVVIAAIMTGNTVVGFLGSVVFAVIVPLAASLVNGYFVVFFETFWPYAENPLYEWGLRISPLVEYIIQLDKYTRESSMVPAAITALAVSAALAGLGCFLYRKRPSEAAGRAMAFAVSRPIIRIVLTLTSAMGLGVFFWGMRNSTGWAVFGIVCGAVICHCVVEIIYNFDFKKLFSHKLQLLGCVLASLAMLLVFRYDLFGYDTYLPRADQVEYGAVDVGTLNNWVTHGGIKQNPNGSYYWSGDNSVDYACQNMEYRDVENLLAIAQGGIRQLDSMEGRQVYEAAYDPDVITPGEDAEGIVQENWSEVTICYTMKNGRKVFRKYHLCLEDIRPQIERLMADEAFQKGVYPVMNRQPGQVAMIRYREGDEEFVLDEMSMDQKDALLAAYQKEFGSLTMEQMYREAPIGLIRFTSSSEELALQWMREQIKKEASGASDYAQGQYYSRNYRGYGNLGNRDYYPVYPSFKETLALLGETNVQAGSYFRGRVVQSITVHKYPDDGADKDAWNASYRDIIITDQEEIKQLLEVLQDSKRTYYNPLFRAESRIEATLTYLQDGETYNENAVFPAGQVPQMVWDHLKEEP